MTWTLVPQGKVAEIRLVVGEPKAKRVRTTRGGPTVALQIRDNQEVPLSVEALDAEGNVDAQATPEWTSSDDTIASVDASGLVTASPGAAGLGSATITATMTDPDGNSITGTFDIEVVAGDATTINITAGAPTDKV